MSIPVIIKLNNNSSLTENSQFSSGATMSFKGKIYEKETLVTWDISEFDLCNDGDTGTWPKPSCVFYDGNLIFEGQKGAGKFERVNFKFLDVDGSEL